MNTKVPPACELSAFSILIRTMVPHQVATALRSAIQLIDEWVASNRIPTQKLDGSSSTRRTIPTIFLRPGDQLRITGMPDGQETAALDYIEVVEGP